MRERQAARPRVSWIGALISLLCLAFLIVFSVFHWGDERQFALLLQRAEPFWLLLAVALQAGTYLCAGAIWGMVASAAGHRLAPTHLARLSVEKLSVDQFVPAGGLFGNVVVVNALRKKGLPATVATEALLVDLISHYLGLALLSLAALGVLWFHHRVTPVILGLVGLFGLLVAGVPSAIAWFLRHRDFQPGPRLRRFRASRRLLEVLRRVSPERVWNARLLLGATSFQIGIFVLDAATFWTVLHALGSPVHLLTTFAAVVVATIAGMFSLLPGGVGSYEAAAIGTLVLLDVPVEAALTGTLLLRGLTLWLPLVPGLLFARSDLVAEGGGEGGPGPEGEAVDPLLPLEELITRLASDRGGLTEEEAARRHLSWGPNAIGAPRSGGTLVGILRTLGNPLALILLAAAVAAAFLGQVADPLIITAVVLLSGAVNFWQSSRSAKAIERLQARIAPQATVIRGGSSRSVPREEVVVGDVVRLSAGDLVPADARLLEAVDLHVQQAALTGESIPAEKVASEGPLLLATPDAKELIFVGTSVVSGSATALVFAIGGSTQFGDVARRIAARPEETEFERGLRRFGMLILRTVVFLVLFIVIVGIAMEHDPLESVMFAVALAVGLTPEYLPMILTVTLSQGALRMAKEKVIVRHLASIQNLGSIDVLCCDKTGTLTTGEMRLDASVDPLGAPSERPLVLGSWNSALETGVKSPLDAAILLRAQAMPVEIEKIAEIPFDFERRRLSVVLREGGRVLLVTKGAPESVLSICEWVELAGEARPFDEALREAALGVFERISGEGYRALGVAYRALDGEGGVGRDAEAGLTFVGFLSFADQLLEGAAEAIEALRADGVEVKVLSGDNELVARTICKKVGLDVGAIASGERLAHLDALALARLAEETTVFARVSPAQKQRIVQALQHSGRVVGFMGDGINDAPSLHSADVGISVAGAVDVAQESSDILLLERRLEVLHGGILAGRRASANVLKYLLMGTSSNFGNMLSMAGAISFLPFLPMLPTQILVNNFLYDLAQITIPTDRVDPAYLRAPQRWDIGLVRRFMWTIGPLSSIFDFLTFGALLLVFRFGASEFQSGWFVESLTTQVLVVFVIRTMGRPWANRPSRPLALTVLVVVLVGIFLPFSPFAGPLGFTPLPWQFFAFIAAVIPTYLALVELVKTRLVRRVLAVEFSADTQ